MSSTKTDTVRPTTVERLHRTTQPVLERVQAMIATATGTSGSSSSAIGQKLSSILSVSHKEKTPVSNDAQNRRLEQRIALFETYGEVDLDQQQVTDEDMPIVSREAIMKKQCVQLLLRRNQITKTGARTLADALRNNNTLQDLFLTHNQISDKGVKALAEALCVNNNNLKHLALGWNRITDKGVEYLAEMLKTNTKLLRIGLFNNEIGDRGVRLLSKVLSRHNNTLQGLCLDENTSITDTSVDFFVEMMKQNQSLQELLINKCGLSPKGAKKLRKTAETKGNFRFDCE